MNERDRMPRFSLLRNIRQDLHFSFRSLHRSPGLTSAVVTTLSIGFGPITTLLRNAITGSIRIFDCAGINAATAATAA